MRFLLPWSAAPDLSELTARPFSPGVEAGPRPRDLRDRYVEVAGQEAPGPPEPGGPYERLAREVLAYRVFPPNILRPLLARSPVQVGDTLGARARLLPGLDLFFGGRVVAVFDGPEGSGWRTGFTFRTLVGHPMVGEETIWVEKDEAGVVRVGLAAWSRSGTWLTWLGRPLARWMQVRAGRRAVAMLAAHRAIT